MNSAARSVILTVMRAKYSKNQTLFIHGFHTSCQTVFIYAQPKILYRVTSNPMQQF